MNNITLIIALTALTFLVGCNHRPNQVIDAAQVAGLELAAIKAEANRQQQVINERTADLARSVSRHLELTRDFEQNAQSLPLLWRIRDDKPRLRFLGELKADDKQLLADPYLLARRPPAPNPGAAIIDTVGLDNAIEGVGRIAEQPPQTTKQGAELAIDALKKVELPKSP